MLLYNFAEYGGKQSCFIDCRNMQPVGLNQEIEFQAQLIVQKVTGSYIEIRYRGQSFNLAIQMSEQHKLPDVEVKSGAPEG